MAARFTAVAVLLFGCGGNSWESAPPASAALEPIGPAETMNAPSASSDLGASTERATLPRAPTAGAPQKRWETIVIGRGSAYEGAVFAPPRTPSSPAAPGTVVYVVPSAGSPVYGGAFYGQGVHVPGTGYGGRPFGGGVRPNGGGEGRAPGGLPPVGGDWPRVPDYGMRVP